MDADAYFNSYRLCSGVDYSFHWLGIISVGGLDQSVEVGLKAEPNSTQMFERALTSY